MSPTSPLLAVPPAPVPGPACPGHRRIGAGTGLIALLGDPVAHSLSPRMQNAALLAVGADLRYLAFRVGEADFLPAVRGLAALGARGANVTVPHKERARACADRLSPEAERTGAANALLFAPGGIEGHNTDVAGVRAALEELGAPLDRGALILGAGGAARAAAEALRRAGVRPIRVANRSLPRAERLLADLARPEGILLGEALPLGALPPEAPGILIQATSCGLADTPFPEELTAYREALLEALLPEGVLLDLVYDRSGPTGWVRAARRRGLRAETGEGVLLHQGAEAFRLFTGLPAPIGVMRAALRGDPGPGPGDDSRAGRGAGEEEGR